MNLKEINPKNTARKMNKILESRFGYAINYQDLSMQKARLLHQKISEGLGRIRRSNSFHTAERNPKYMELLMVHEALSKWIDERSHRQLTEGELGKSEAILAAKDMVDSIQDMLEKVSKMQVEQMPALIDIIRDQIGNEQADSFKTSVGQLLTNMVEQMTQARDQADTASRQLAGEHVDTPMAMPDSDAMPTGPDFGPESDLDMDGDETFSASDAAAGGPEELGREKR